MPKAASRQSGPKTVSPRSEPYPAIKPGDKSGSIPTKPKASEGTSLKPVEGDKTSARSAAEKQAASADKPSSFLDVELDQNCPM